MKKITKSYKCRIRPTKEQETKMWRFVGASRFVYNMCLDLEKKAYDDFKEKENSGFFTSDNEKKRYKKFYTAYDLGKLIVQLKKQDDYAWLNEIASRTIEKACANAYTAYKNFFSKRTKFPRYKSRSKSRPSFGTNHQTISIKDSRVLISKIGYVKINTDKDFSSVTKFINPHVSNDGKFWYVSFGVEEDYEEPELTDESIGIDLGIKELAVCSNEMVFDNINKSATVRGLEKRMRRLQRKLSRKYEMNKQGSKFVKTKNIMELEHQIKMLYRRLSNIRNTHIHNTTRKIVNTHPRRIVMEDLNVRGMMKNKHLSRQIGQQGFFEFKRQMMYKSDWDGIEFVEADKWYPSSKTCSGCGHKIDDLNLSDRTYRCPECGLEIDRDLNASINLSKYEKPSK